MTFDSCPETELLRQFLAGHGDPTVTDHVEQCSRCQSQVEQLLTRPPNDLVDSDDLRLAAELTGIDRANDATELSIEELRDHIDIPGTTLDAIVGRGGMGVVLSATQNVPIERRVAVKVVRTGRADSEFQTRFRREQQLLASLEHPHIARLYDAGETSEGILWFMMEFVDGEDFRSYLITNQLPLRQRIELLLQLCNAVQHLHRNQIVHRDLKPANVLITAADDRPVVKLIDLGLARILRHANPSHASTGNTTSAEIPIGTPRYMSPEQSGFRDNLGQVDATSDVYSLGVMLFELLTGDTPLPKRSLENSDFIEAMMRIRELDPQPPSARLKETDESFVATLRQTRTTLQKEYRRDLDWIVLKAIQRDRMQRYRSVEAFANDLENYLLGREVSARPPTPGYQLRKYVQRHKIAVVGATASVLLLVAGLIGTSYGILEARKSENAAIQAARDEAVAKKAAQEARDLAIARLDQLKLTTNTLRSVFDGINPALATGSDGQLREALLNNLKLAAEQILNQELGGNDDTLLVKMSLANLLASLGSSEHAIPLLTNIWEVVRDDDTIAAADKLAAISTLATTHMKAGQHDKAVKLCRQSVTLSKELLPDSLIHHFAMQHYLASALMEADRLDESLEVRQAIHGLLSPDEPSTLSFYAQNENSMAILQHKTGQLEEAAESYRNAFQAYSKLVPENHESLLTIRSNIALIEGESDPAKASKELREILLLTQEKYPADSPRVQHAAMNLACSLVDQKQFDAASTLLQSAVESEDSAVKFRARVQLLLLSQLRGEDDETIKERAIMLQKQMPEAARKRPDSAKELRELINELESGLRN